MIYLVLHIWLKPVITVYRDRRPQPERTPLAVIQAKKLTVTPSEKKTLEGTIEYFFPLMGNIDYITFKGGKIDRYILCWFDDKEDDFRQAARRLGGVTFLPGMAFEVDQQGKRIYNASFKAEYGKVQ